MRNTTTGKKGFPSRTGCQCSRPPTSYIMAVVPIKSENVFAPGIFDIVGNSSIGYLQQGSMTESPALGGTNPPTGNLAVNNLVMIDQTIQFKFEWGVFGTFAHALNPAFEWRIQLYFEQYGVGEYNIGPIGSKVVPMGSGNAVGLLQVDFPGTASTTITIPGGTVPPGLYDVVAVIQLYDMPSGLPCFAAAFAEFNKINFYQEH